MRRNSQSDIEQERVLRNASRRLLFGNETAIPGEGKSAAERPRRHVRHKVTMNLDSDIVEYFKSQAEADNTPYQFLINQVLREYVRGSRPEQLARDVGEVLLSDESFREKIQRLISAK